MPRATPHARIGPVEPAAPPGDAAALLRSGGYLKLLVLAGIIGVPVSAVAYGFLKLVDWLQAALFDDLPGELGFDSPPLWWPLPLLMLGGLLTAAAILLLPGTGGHSPADGLKTGGALPVRELPGVVLAALATLCFGAVLGPEAPLIAIGSGLGALAVGLAAKDAPDRSRAVVAAAGSFAAISALLGSPLLGAFLLLEASGLGGPMLGVVLVPGLLAAGVGTLIFVGLDSLTGFGTFSLAVPGLPPAGPPTLAAFGWAIVLGLLAPCLGLSIRRFALWLRGFVEPRMVVVMPVLGAAIAGLAIGFEAVTDHPASAVLFSGQSGIGGLITGAGSWSVGALLLLLGAKGLGYALSLSAFRGGPVFPAIFLGAAGGIAASRLPGLELVPAVAMGIGAMVTVMLGLPLTAVLLATVLLSADGLQVMPLVIVAVVVAYVATARLTPASPPSDDDPAAHPGSMSPTTSRRQTAKT
jgi:H+/Cl- antiporter ClcA